MWQFLANSLQDTSPILFAALGGLLAFRAGIFHLGLEGLVCMASFTAVAVSKETGSATFGVLAAIASAVLLSVLYWFLIDVMNGNVIIVGLGITGIGVAGSSYLLQVVFNTQGAIQTANGLYHPVVGHARGPLSVLNGLSILTWCLPVVVFLIWVLVRRSFSGLALTAVGEFPFAARSAGIAPRRARLLALIGGGVLCGLAGSELSLGNLDSFTPNLTNGLGYVAFTAVVFGAVAPLGVAAAGIGFGIANAIGIQAQLERWSVPTEIIMMLPYVLTLIAVTIAAGFNRGRGAAQAGFAELRS
ncbi:ABC transporter permease [Streptomyces sp. NPDC005820]|uniref:ABC transporter permease n=1 Tax=Streptomyces sp. NPDC005820 TaxID=3157069 RepID=UPI003403E5DC